MSTIIFYFLSLNLILSFLILIIKDIYIAFFVLANLIYPNADD